jgi:exopolysaccharide production protein ExoQ
MSQGMHSQISETNRVRSYDTRQSLGASLTALSGPTPKAIFEKCAIVPISACIYALIVSPLLTVLTSPDLYAFEKQTLVAQPDIVSRIFWPAMTAISAILAVQNRYRLSRLTWPPHIICLLVYLAFAGASVLWAFSPQSSLTRFVQEVMIITSIVLPAMLAARTADMMRGLFLCFALSLILNLPFVLGGSVNLAQYGAKLLVIGYQGYFEGKNYLGEFAAVAFLLSLHEMLYPGWRRALGIIVAVIAIWLVFLSSSKTALGLALISPSLAALTLIVRKITGISTAIIPLSIPVCYFILSSVSNFTMNRISYMLYGDSTFTGRTIIWDFAQYEIDRSPLVGWGYRSFWLVPDSPSLEAPGWVKMMPNAHNGYVDTKLELGYVGLALLIAFIVATLHAIGRVADRDPPRARLLLSLALFIIVYNFLESLWMRGFEFLWVVFLIVAAETGRYWGPFPPGRAPYRSRSPGRGSPGPSLDAPRPRLRVGLS